MDRDFVACNKRWFRLDVAISITIMDWYSHTRMKLLLFIAQKRREAMPIGKFELLEEKATKRDKIKPFVRRFAVKKNRKTPPPLDLKYSFWTFGTPNTLSLNYSRVRRSQTRIIASMKISLINFIALYFKAILMLFIFQAIRN